MTIAAAAFVFVNLIALGVLHIDPSSPGLMLSSSGSVVHDVTHHGLGHAIKIVTIGVASCVLAYSGIDLKDIREALERFRGFVEA